MTTVRMAGLDDTEAISALLRADIGVWQRIGADGRVEDVPYPALSVYERWTHGGAWMGIETAAIWLNQLLLGAGLPFVAEGDGRICGYLEAFPSHEPEPYGRCVHVVRLHAPDEVIEAALLAALRDWAKRQRYARLTITRLGDVNPLHSASLTPIERIQRYTLSARQGTVFYRAVEQTDADAARIDGWGMTIGRAECARYGWETLMPRTFETLPPIKALRADRRSFSVAGLDAIMVCRQNVYDPRRADVALWTPKPLAVQIVSAVRDWAHREGYRQLMLAVDANAAVVLGADAEADGYGWTACTIDP